MEIFGTIRKLFRHYLIVHLTDVDPPNRRFIEANVGQLVSVRFDDGRHITADQRKKIYVIFSEIDEWMGTFDSEVTKRQMKREFNLNRGVYEDFSLSNCSIALASQFLEFLIAFCFKWNVPFASKKVDAIRESYGWDLQCLKTHRCMICAQPADIAHVHAVGIGRNRNHISHVGNSVMALCRNHHQEQHRIGIDTFMKKYQLKGVRVTPEIAKMLRLGSWRAERGEPIVATKEK